MAHKFVHVDLREEKEQFTYVLGCEELSQGSNMTIC